jgi:hypothetical protein
MYWRKRTITIEQTLKQYWVPVALAISLFTNLILFATRPNLNKQVDKGTKEQFDEFAAQVTRHLLDSSYISYPQSMNALLSTELDPRTIAKLRSSGVIASTQDEYQATEQTLERDKQVSAVRIDSILQSDPNDQGLVPIDIIGAAATHATDSAEGPTPFHFRFLIGINKNTQKPIVAAFSE